MSGYEPASRTGVRAPTPPDLNVSRDRWDAEDQWRARFCQPLLGEADVAYTDDFYFDRYSHHWPETRETSR